MSALMMNNSSQRLLEWRKFRTSLNGKSELDQLADLAKYWSLQPIVSSNVLDRSRAFEWPTPWEILHVGDYCSTTIAYMMEQTLILQGWAANRLQMFYVQDMDTMRENMILLVDNHLALNYSFGEVFDFDNVRHNCNILSRYCITDRGRISY